MGKRKDRPWQEWRDSMEELPRHGQEVIVLWGTPQEPRVGLAVYRADINRWGFLTGHTSSEPFEILDDKGNPIKTAWLPTNNTLSTWYGKGNVRKWMPLPPAFVPREVKIKK